MSDEALETIAAGTSGLLKLRHDGILVEKVPWPNSGIHNLLCTTVPNNPDLAQEKTPNHLRRHYTPTYTFTNIEEVQVGSRKYAQLTRTKS